MNYVGIDIHKRYSLLAAQDEEGRQLKEARTGCSAHRRTAISVMRS